MKNKLFLLAVVLLLLSLACDGAATAVNVVMTPVLHTGAASAAPPSWTAQCVAYFVENFHVGAEEARRRCFVPRILVVESLSLPPAWPHHVPAPAAVAAAEALQEGEAPGGVIYTNGREVVILSRKAGKVWKIVYRIVGDKLEFATNYEVTGGDAWLKAVNRAVRGDGMRKVSARALGQILLKGGGK